MAIIFKAAVFLFIIAVVAKTVLLAFYAIMVIMLFLFIFKK